MAEVRGCGEAKGVFQFEMIFKIRFHFGIGG